MKKMKIEATTKETKHDWQKYDGRLSQKHLPMTFKVERVRMTAANHVLYERCHGPRLTILGAEPEMLMILRASFWFNVREEREK